MEGLSPRKVLVAEDERNDPTLITQLGFDGVWADDFHHQLRVLLTGERHGYYAAFEPDVAQLARTIERGWLYEGQPSPVTGQARGAPADPLPAHAFVHCIQNHDQIGNRALGERLSTLVSSEAYLAASVLLLFLPSTPLLFMGQEWAATAPFLYFTDHDRELGPKISAGRRAELAAFPEFSDPSARAAIPDPQSRLTFARSKLDWSERDKAGHEKVFTVYKRMIALRHTDPVLALGGRAHLAAEARGDVLVVTRRLGSARRTLIMSFNSAPIVPTDLVRPSELGELLLRTGETGDLRPHEAAVYSSG